MDLGIIYKELSTANICRILQHNIFSDVILRKTVYVKEEKKTYYGDTLYIFSELPNKNVDNFVCITSDEQLLDIDLVVYKDCNYLIMTPNNSEEEVIDFLFLLFDDDLRLNIAIQPLINALLKDKGLQELSDIVSKILGNPFWIIDMNYNFLTQPYGLISNENILEEIQRGYVLDETVMQLRKSHTRDIVSRMNEAYSYKVHNMDKHMIMAAVKIKGATVAYINVYDENHDFTSYDFRVMNRVSDIIANELQKSVYFKNNQGIMYSYLLTDLLEDKFYHQSDLEKRLFALGYQPEKFFYVLTIELAKVESRDMQLNAINEQIRYIFKNSIYSVYDKHSVFLISKKNTLTEQSVDMQQLEDYINASSLSAALSAPFTDIRQTRHYYQQTLEALRLRKKVLPDNALVYYPNISFMHLLDYASGQFSYRDFCDGAIIKQEKYDEAKGTDYLYTVYTFLMHNMQIPSAAKALMIHENTMRYRLEKAKDIMEISLENGHQIMEFLLGYQMYLYAKK